MAYKGKYNPQNTDKYIGNHRNIVYRSLLERRFMVFCDKNPNILKWASEELFIPYLSPVDNRVHKYYVDFIIEVREKDGTVKTYLIEIKPYRHCQQPKQGVKKSRNTFLKEVKTWAINNSKWKAAEEFAKKQNWQFKIITERNLTQNG
jgi:hypothetical protein